MDWFASVDGYCERLDASFWAEPVNAITNAAFLIAALVVWLRTDARKDAGAVALLGILVAIGIGSFLFHTIAQRWAALADTLPILLFILTYLYLATLRFLGL
ncbi:MAG TPA: ceramidase domain-containing protein, partial [Paracoccaceae bacterium]|nr:ceramidase domain-containing protein [Paracoccaceae bacterium]